MDMTPLNMDMDKPPPELLTKAMGGILLAVDMDMLQLLMVDMFLSATDMTFLNMDMEPEQNYLLFLRFSWWLYFNFFHIKIVDTYQRKIHWKIMMIDL